MFKNNLMHIFVIIIGIIFSGCVGTIKDANKEETKTSSSGSDSSVAEFTGITSATPVANDKVEVFFPASSLDPDKIAYVIRYDGLQIPIYIFGTSLRTDYKGLLRYTVTNLQINSNYTFSVQVRDVSSGVESNNTVLKQARTFSNLTSNFMGISELRNLTGADGATGIEVFWIPAQVKGSLINKDEIDPIEYRVTVIDGTILNPNNMNDSSFDAPDRRVSSIGGDKNSTKIRGLISGRKYYVQVRAINYGYSLNSADSSYKVDSNNNYLQISTYTDDVSSVIFDESTFVLGYPPGAAGLYSLKTSWEAPVGNFDHYRIYYAKKNDNAGVLDYLNSQNGDSVCLGPESIISAIHCDYFNSNSNSNNVLPGLSPNTEYEVVLAICVSSACEIGKRIITNVFSQITTPNVADFNGIQSIEPAKNVSNLDQITLKFELPNFLSGNISGYILQYFGNDPGLDALSVNDTDKPNETGLSVLPYDVYNDTSIVVSGIDPLSTDQYCFKLIPFSYNIDGSKTIGNTSGIAAKCITPILQAPNSIEFEGIDLPLADNSGCKPTMATISWKTPTSGIYLNYEVFYTDSAAVISFSFPDAINYDVVGSLYKRVLINSTTNSFTLTGIQAGKNYRFGVLTLYNSIDGPLRSEYNAGSFTCSPLPLPL